MFYRIITLTAVGGLMLSVWAYAAEETAHGVTITAQEVAAQTPAATQD